MKKTVIFDFADTIAELYPRNYDLVNSLTKQIGIELDELFFNLAFRFTFENNPYSSIEINSPDAKSNFYRSFNSCLLKNLGLYHLLETEKLCYVFDNTIRHWRLKTGFKILLNDFCSRGISVGIISNFDSVLEQILRQMDVLEQISFLSISQKRGLEKPDKNFYLDFFEIHCLKIDDCLYIGDSYNLDYLPANSLGIETYLLDDKNVYPKFDYVLNDISDINGRI